MSCLAGWRLCLGFVMRSKVVFLSFGRPCPGAVKTRKKETKSSGQCRASSRVDSSSSYFSSSFCPWPVCLILVVTAMLLHRPAPSPLLGVRARAFFSCHHLHIPQNKSPSPPPRRSTNAAAPRVAFARLMRLSRVCFVCVCASPHISPLPSRLPLASLVRFLMYIQQQKTQPPPVVIQFRTYHSINHVHRHPWTPQPPHQSLHQVLPLK